MPHPAEVPQHMRALRQANTVRLARACLMRDVENGDVSLAEAIANPASGTMAVLTLVERLPFPNTSGPQRKRATVGSAPRRNTRRAEQLLKRAGIRPSAEVGLLTARKCAELIAEWNATCVSVSR